MRLLWGLCAILLCVDVQAATLQIGNATDSELKALPKYCYAKLRLKRKAQEYQHWLGVLGPDYENTHHLCAAKAFIGRAKRRDEHRKFYLQEAFDNLKYMETHSKPDYTLMPDVFYLMAYVESKRNKIIKAINYANKSIKSNEKYLKPYLLLSDIYLKQKRYEDSREVLNKAQQYFPKSRALKRRIKKLENIKNDDVGS